MTKAITKKPITVTIAAIILLGTILITSNTLTNNVEAQTALPSSPCPPDGEVQHWDKIVFQITDDKSKTIPKDMLKKTLDLKILDTPEEIVDLEQEVKNAVGEKFGVDPSDVKIKIKDVLYQTVSCAGSGPAGPQVKTLSDGVCTGFPPDIEEAGWCPDGIKSRFAILDSELTLDSVVILVTVDNGIGFAIGGPVFGCSPQDIQQGTGAPEKYFVIDCDSPPFNGVSLNYAVINS